MPWLDATRRSSGLQESRGELSSPGRAGASLELAVARLGPTRLEQAGVLAAIDGKRGSGDETRGVTGEEHDRSGQLIGAPMPAQRDVADASRRELFGTNPELGCLVAVLFGDAVSLEAAGGAGIEPAFRGPLLREGLSHRDHRRPHGGGEHQVVDGLMGGDRGEADDGGSTL